MTGHIQVGDVSPRVQYVANGSQTVFYYPFPIFADADLEVWVNTARLAASAYAVAGAGASEGGYIILAAAPPASAIVTLRRRLTLRRTSDFHDDGIIRAKVVNDELDYQTMSVQQVAEDVDRAIKRSHTSRSTADLTLPDPLPGRAIKWNAAATGLENSGFDVDQMVSQTIARANDARSSAQVAQASAATSVDRAAAATASASVASAAAAAAVAVVGFGIDSDPALSANGDTRVATQKAVKAYADRQYRLAAPPGMVGLYPVTWTPSGWLKCNGAAVSRKIYPELFAVLGTYYGAGDGYNTFTLPDLRGEFVRGYDDWRGLDAGRSVGSVQYGSNLSHDHGLKTDGGVTGFGELVFPDYGAGPWVERPWNTANDEAANGYRVATFASGGSENRPRNVALLYCIKY